MKHIGQTLKKHIEDNNLVKKDVAEKAGISRSHLSTLFTQDTCDALLLEKVCLAAGLHPGSMFDVPDSVQRQFCDIQAQAFLGTAMVNINQAESLKEILAAKDRLIEEKERTIQLLMTMAGHTDPSQDRDTSSH